MILALLAAAAAQPADTPRAFVEHLYASYRNADFSPFKHPERVFAASLKAALDEDSRLADGEVGYLDGDPVCQCQDTAGLKSTITSVRAQGAHKAVVSVSISLVRYEVRRAKLSLVHTTAGWRIADIAAAGEPSLLRALEESNKRARAKRR